MDENGHVEEILDFELANTYYVKPDAATLNGAATQSPVTPNPNTNFYDLSNGKYYLYSGQSQTVYEMDKWFHANSDGYLYISSSVSDADGTLKFYTYKFNDTTHFRLIREYALNINSNNSRTRVYKGTVSSKTLNRHALSRRALKRTTNTFS